MKDTECPQNSLPSALRVLSPGLVTLYHTRLISAVNGPLLLLLLLLLLRGGACLLRTASSLDPGKAAWVASLFYSFAVWKRWINRTAIFSRPLVGEKFFQKMCFSFEVLFPRGVTQSLRLHLTSLHPLSSALLLLSLATSPSRSHSCLLFWSVSSLSPSPHNLSLSPP